MTPDKVRAMVSAMQAAGEDDDAIKAALDLARSQEKPTSKGHQGPPVELTEPTLLENIKRWNPSEMPGEFLNGVSATASKFMNGLTLGGAGAVRRAVMGDDKANAQEQWENETLDNPISRTAGNVASTAGSGITLAPVGAGISGLIERGLPGIGATAGRRILGNAMAGGATNAIAGTTEAAFDRAPPKEVVKRGLLGLVSGGVLGGGLSALGEAAGGVYNAVRNSAGGQARQRLEARGANVGPLDSGSGGVFNNELAGLQPNDRGIGQASRRAAAGTLSKLDDDYFANVANPHSANRAAIAASPAGEAERDITPIYSELVKVYQSERLTPGERGQVRSILDRLDQHIGERNGKTGLYMSENDLNDFRGMLQDVSKTGSPANPTVAQGKMQKVAHTTKEAVDQGPYAETNAAFHEGREAYEGRRQLLDLPAKPSSSLDPAREAPEGGREPEVAKLANMLARDEQNTVTAGVRNSDRIAQFIEQNPEYADILQLPRLLEDKSNLQFRLGSPHHGGLINRIKHEGAPAAVLYALTEMGTHNHGLAAGVAAGAHLLKTNAAPIAGRLLYGPTEGAANALRGAAKASPVTLPAFLPEIEQAYADYLARQQQENQ